ncbi:MAG: hypothetical protein ACHREM_28905 [Polyangiales bacterium]
MAGLWDSVRRAIIAQWAIALPVFALFWIFPYLPDLRSPNELCRLHQTRALVDHHTIEINQTLREWGWAGDLSCVAIRRVDGLEAERKPCPEVRGRREWSEEHFYPSKAPLLSFAAAPVLWALEHWRGGARAVPELALVFFGRLFCTILPTALMLIPLRRYLRARTDRSVADALVATYALGTLAFSYSELFMSHQTTAVLVFLTFYSVWRLGRGEWRDDLYLLSGLLAGLTVASEYTGALPLVPLALYGVATAKRKIKALVFASVGLTPVVIALMWYHSAAFGDPFVTGYKFLNDGAYQHWHLGGFLGIRYPDPRAFVLSFCSPLRGLFALSPVLALGVLGLPFGKWSRDLRKERALSVAVLLLFAYFTSSFTYDSWGWTTGPRHLTPLVPFLLVPIAALVTQLRGRFGSVGVVAGLAAVSIFVTSTMTFVDYIPDSVTDGLTELAIPLVKTGHFPNSLAAIAGVANPLAIAPAILAVALTIVGVVVALVDVGHRAASSALALAAFVGFLALHGRVKPENEGMVNSARAMKQLLENSWIPKPKTASPKLFPQPPSTSSPRR